MNILNIFRQFLRIRKHIRRDRTLPFFLANAIVSPPHSLQEVAFDNILNTSMDDCPLRVFLLCGII